MIIKILVEVELKHDSGKFASKDELADKLCQEIEERLSLDDIQSDDEAIYNIDILNVSVA